MRRYSRVGDTFSMKSFGGGAKSHIFFAFQALPLIRYYSVTLPLQLRPSFPFQMNRDRWKNENFVFT